MSFPEAVIKDVRRRAHVRCCICGLGPGIDIHHITPKAKNGPDVFDNAAPLCPNCHLVYGGNPNLRKRIRERRDAWYAICAAREKMMLSYSERQLVDRVLREEDYENIIMGTWTGAPEGLINNETEKARFYGYSFVCDELINPSIVQELLGWISDRHETISSINLTTANHSNQFSGEIKTEVVEDRKWVKSELRDGGYLRYSHVGTAPSGVEIIECYNFGCGSGNWGSVALFQLEIDSAWNVDENRIVKRERVILRSLGSIALGDRYKGEISYKDGILNIGADQGWFKRGDAAIQTIAII